MSNILPGLNPEVGAALKDAGAILTSANWQVDGSDVIFNTGTEPTWTPFVVEIKVSALEIDTGDELYRLLIQGSTKADFADTIVNLAELRLGPAATLDGDVASDVGTYLLYGHNDVGGTVYPYVRGRTVIAGTIASGINHSAQIGIIPIP